MQKQLNPIQQHLHEIIFGTETKSRKLFNLALIATILASVFVVLLDSFRYVHLEYGELLL